MQPDNVFIRALTESDQDVLWEAIYHAIFVPPGQEAPPADLVRDPAVARYVEGWGRPGDTGVLGFVGDTVVGAAWVRLLTGERRGYGYVDDETPELSIAVWPGHRGRGIGTQLLARLFELLDARLDAVSLSVSAANPARRLYQRHGFEKIGESGDSHTMLRRRPR